MARRGTVKLSIQSTYDDKGTRQAERALDRFQKKFELADNSQAMALARSSVKWDRWASDIEAKTGRVGRAIQGLGNSMSRTGDALTVGVTAPIIAAGSAMTSAAIDFESAFAGVIKTVDATDEQLSELRVGIREMAMELPATREEIAGVAEAAGQLGIQTDSILSFTRVMIDLGEATDLSANDAATSLAQLANVTGMSQDEFSNLGSAVVALGNNMATTESKIVEMSMRIAGAGSQVGMTEDEILALAASLSSVGIEAEAGGSAISKTMIEIARQVATGGDKLEQFAKIAGMSSERFSTAWEEDATAALLLFVEGLASAEEQGTSTLQLLEDLEITEVRQRDALLRAAGASDMMTDAVRISSNAWRENTALTKEAEQRYETTESQLKILRNQVSDVALEFGEALAPALMDAVDAARPILEWAKRQAEAFSALDKEQQQQIIQWVAIAAAAGPVLSVTGRIVTAVGSGVEAYGKIASAIGTYIAKRQAATAADMAGVGPLKNIASATGAAKLGYVGLAAAVGVATGNLINQIPAVKKNAEALGQLAGEVDSLTEYMIESGKHKPWWAYAGPIGSGIYAAQQVGGAAGYVSGKSPSQNAAGGVVTSPTLSWLAENRHPEYVITTEPSFRSRSLDLYAQLGDRLGVSSNSVTIAPGAVQISVSGSSASPTSIAAEVERALQRVVRSSQLMGA
jgi:TP901 family phage tail tape measure protein